MAENNSDSELTGMERFLRENDDVSLSEEQREQAVESGRDPSRAESGTSENSSSPSSEDNTTTVEVGTVADKMDDSGDPNPTQDKPQSGDTPLNTGAENVTSGNFGVQDGSETPEPDTSESDTSDSDTSDGPQTPEGTPPDPESGPTPEPDSPGPSTPDFDSAPETGPAHWNAHGRATRTRILDDSN